MFTLMGAVHATAANPGETDDIDGCTRHAYRSSRSAGTKRFTQRQHLGEDRMSERNVVKDGRLAYYQAKDKQSEPDFIRLIRFPYLTVDLIDEYGYGRLDYVRLVHDGVRLETNTINWLMRGIKESYRWQYELFYWIGAAWPLYDYEPPLKLVDCLPFEPSLARHAIIIRLINLNNRHWEALAHFHTLDTIVFFNSSGTYRGDQFNKKSDLGRAVESQLVFVSGSKAAPESREKLTVKFQPYSLQNDDWSCGLWCFSFIYKITELLSERRALDGENINYEMLLFTLEEEMEKGLTRLSVEEAHRLTRIAWVTQEEPVYNL